MTRSGLTVALVGPDGAGKTTVARMLEHVLPPPVVYLYMGVNPDSSNHLLPTTRLVRAVRRRDGGPAGSRAAPRRRGTLAAVRSALRLLNRLAEEWHRQLLASWHVRRGATVVFDRHFFADYHASDVTGATPRPLARRVHGFLLSRAYPKPDLVVYLDAPPEVLHARKGEGTLESLARRREEYLRLGDVIERFVVVDADRPLSAVVGDVASSVLLAAGDGSER